MDKRNRKTEQGKETFEADIGNDGCYSQVEDVVMKTVMQCFKDELLPYLGIKEKAVAIAPTEAVHLELKKLLQDFNLVMQDGTWSHFEFRSKNEGLEGLKRFRVYEAVTSYQYKVNITTHVLFSGKIRNPMTEFTEGLNTYRIKPIILTKFNVDELMKKLQEKIDVGEKLTKEDLVPLTLCPLMGGNLSQKDRIKKALEFSRKAEEDIPKREVEKIESVVYAMAEKFLENVETNEIREMMKMTRLGQMLRAEGREEGRAEERYQNLISKILRKIQKNCTVPEIADMLEEDEEIVQKIYDIAISQGKECDVEQIYQEFMQNRMVEK